MMVLKRAILGLERGPASKFGFGARGCDPLVYNIFGYGAVRSGTGRYTSGPAQPFNFAFGRYAGPVEQQEQQEQQQEQQGKN